MLFVQEIRASPGAAGAIALGIGLTLLGVLSASAANIIQAGQRAKAMPLASMIAWGMAYGALANAALALALYGAPQLETRPGYWLGVLYLGLFASALAFPLYFAVMRAVGPGKAAYSSLLVPILAMAISTVAEGYRWTSLAVAGGMLAMIGLFIALRSGQGRAAGPGGLRRRPMRLKIDVSLDYAFPEAADVLLAVEAGQLADQLLLEDLLTVGGAGPLRPIAGEEGIGQRTWLRAEGDFRAVYAATVEVERARRRRSTTFPARRCATSRPQSSPISGPAATANRTSSRPSSRRSSARSRAAPRSRRWPNGFAPKWPMSRGSSDSQTTAADAFVQRQGVCRDYAHLMATFARAAGIPARLVSAYAWQLDPPDFHAVVEVWLDGAWHLVDATGLAPIEGLVRICVGRDATDIAFMTIFGAAEMVAQSINVTRLDA